MKQILHPQIESYIASTILPMYQTFDKGHQTDHAQKVMADSLLLAQNYDVDWNMVYVIAAYHDVGLSKDREKHHLFSGEMLAADPTLRKWFNDEQIQLMKEAVEDHRASSDRQPRSIYGKIVAEADRDISPETIIRRTVQYGLKKYPESDKAAHYERMKQHLQEKYGRQGYLKLWLESEKNQRGLEAIRQLLDNETAIKKLFNQFFEEESK